MDAPVNSILENVLVTIESKRNILCALNQDCLVSEVCS